MANRNLFNLCEYQYIYIYIIHIIYSLYISHDLILMYINIIIKIINMNINIYSNIDFDIVLYTHYIIYSCDHVNEQHMSVSVCDVAPPSFSSRLSYRTDWISRRSPSSRSGGGV